MLVLLVFAKVPDCFDLNERQLLLFAKASKRGLFCTKLLNSIELLNNFSLLCRECNLPTENF